MEVNPPISNRSTEELLEIVEMPKGWQAEIVTLAQKELIKRGVSAHVQNIRRKSQSKFQSKIEAIKARSSYTTSEKILIILFGPILIAFLTDLFLFQAGEGYKKKNIQGCLLPLLGLVLWIIVLSIIFN